MLVWSCAFFGYFTMQAGQAVWRVLLEAQG
jgi:hypothetical protein